MSAEPTCADRKDISGGIFICARRWFDSRYGNTYHSVEITFLADGSTLTDPRSYGSDFWYIAGVLLELENPRVASWRSWREENKNKIFYDQVEVKSAKHLHNGGK